MPGSTYQPLNTEAEADEDRSELERFRDAAKAGTVREELVGLTAADTGLRASAIGHMTGDWLDTSSDTLKIDVPQYQKCTLGAGDGQGDTTTTGQPCYGCRQRSMDRDWLPPKSQLPDNGDCWVAKTYNGYKGRSIPVQSEDARDILVNYFRVHDTVCGRNTVRMAIKRIAKRAGVFEPGEGDEQDWPTTHDLRDTFGNRLARKGFNRHEIKEAMGHSKVEMADDYIDLSGREVEKAFDEKW